MKLPIVSRSTLEKSQSQLLELNQEYQNYRRRNADIQGDSYRQGVGDAVRALLPVYDDLLRALEQPCGDAAYQKGVEMTMKSLKKQLEALEVIELSALEQPFDPERHEAAEHIDDPEKGEAVVVRVLRTGFLYRGKVLRPALVTVAN